MLQESKRLIYLLQTKLGTELPADLVHDIESALVDYGDRRAEMWANERKALTELARPEKERRRGGWRQ